MAKKKQQEAAMGFERNKFNSISKTSNTIFGIILGLLSLLMIIPMVLVFIVSFTSNTSIAYNGFSFFPSEWSLEGYQYLFKIGDQVWASYRITIFYTVVGTAMSLSVMSLYAYVLAQTHFKHRKFFTWILFFTMLFGGGLVPSYILYVQYLHIYDTVWVFLLPGLVSAYNVIILRTFIQTTIPDTLFEAAKIDGANNYRCLWNVYLPNAKPILAVIAIYTLVARWNSWYDAMIYIPNPDLQPLQLYLRRVLIDQTVDLTATLSAEDMEALILKQMSNDQLKYAMIIFTTAPIIAAYPFLQRYFVKGVMVGSLKG